MQFSHEVQEPDFPRSDRLLWILAIGAILTFFLNILVDNAVVFHDEYLYKAAADYRLLESELYAKGAIDYIPNRLFVAVYRLASYAEQNYYVASQFFNVVFWALGVFFVCSLARIMGVTGKRVLVFAGLVVLLPLGIYTKYIMPEAMYFCLFALYALLLFKSMFSGSQPLMFLAGWIAGCSYYVKPHALIFFGGTFLFLVTTGGLPAGRLRNVCSFCGAFILVVIIGALVIDKPQGLAHLGIYDQAVKGMLNTATIIAKKPDAHLRAIGNVFLGHAALLLSSWTISIGFALSSLGTTLRRTNPVNSSSHEVRLFGVWLIYILAVLLAVVVTFTVLVGEVGRLHSRYYCFIYPFLLLALFVYDPQKCHWRTKCAMSIVAIVSGLTLLAMPLYSNILGISLVTDSPELGYAFLSKPVASVTIIVMVATHLLAVWRTPLPFCLLLAVTFAFSQYYVRNAQGHIFRGLYTDGRDAMATEQVLGRERLRKAVIVGEGRDALSKFLFNVSVVPITVQRPLEKFGTVLKDYPNTDTFVLLTNKIQEIPQLNCKRLVESVLWCEKNKS